jgi:Cyclin, N-terminal domain
MATIDVSQLPSLKDGMTAEEETTNRIRTCRFIEHAGRELQLPTVAYITAMVFFHRFFAKHSFKEHDRFEVAVASIVLAAKTEESPKKLNMVILECHKLKARAMQPGRISQLQASSPSPPAPSMMLDPKGEEFGKLKERILLLERVILHTIGFELSVDHPHKFIDGIVRKFIQTRALKYIKTPEGVTTQQIMAKMSAELKHYSIGFANDSMHTSLCLQFSPHQIATSCVFLATQFSKVEPVSGDWPSVLGDPDIEALASISVQILDFIADRKASDTDTAKKIRAQLELLKSRDEPNAQNQPSKRPRVS